MTTVVPNVLRVTIEHDADAENPTSLDCQWSIYTFRGPYQRASEALITDCDRSKFFDDETGEPTDEIRDKLARGYAFGLVHREHGICLYETTDDTSDGLIVWEHDESEIGGKTVDELRKNADGFLDEYTNWANGDCYWFRVERIKSVAPDFDPDNTSYNGAFWEEVESCGGLIGSEYTKRTILEITADYPDATVAYKGDAGHIM